MQASCGKRAHGTFEKLEKKSVDVEQREMGKGPSRWEDGMEGAKEISRAKILPW